jgi:hypothetical protein
MTDERMPQKGKWPVPEDIVKMLAAGPGKYVATLDPKLRHYVELEVDDKGRVHQLKNGQRDGVLSNDGWINDVRVYVMTMVEHEGQTIPRFRRIGTEGMDLPEVILKGPGS